jgi:hypothetical protein
MINQIAPDSQMSRGGTEVGFDFFIFYFYFLFFGLFGKKPFVNDTRAPAHESSSQHQPEPPSSSPSPQLPHQPNKQKSKRRERISSIQLSSVHKMRWYQ